MPCLVVIPPGPIHLRAGRLHTTSKFLDGMQAYADRFPGEVILLATSAAGPDDDNLGAVSSPLTELGFECVLADSIEKKLQQIKPEIALIPLSLESAPLFGLARRTVAAVEHTGRSRLAMALAQPHTPIARLRMEVGFRRLGARLTSLATTADALMCNGSVAWDGYGRGHRQALRVYDSRVRSAAVATARSRRLGWSGGTLRLGFSGRLIAIKGPEYAIRLISGLHRMGVPATLDVFGDGPLRESLRASAPEGVTFRGTLDYETEWCDAVASGIDLMVLPHVQGDPSGTYLESAGMGAPVLGFDNPALTSLIEEGGLGWTVPVRSDVRLLAKTQELIADPARIEAASGAAFTFMEAHSFERDFDRRVEFFVGAMR